MKESQSIRILNENLDMLQKANFWLLKSYGICEKYDLVAELSEEQFDSYEILSSRFGRVADILFNKVFRSIAYYEFAEITSLLDTLNFMEKKGLINSVHEARLIKELRNEMVHEYLMEGVTELFSEICRLCPVLLEMVENAQNYVQKIKN